MDAIAFSRYLLSVNERVLRCDGRIIALPPKAIDVLEVLLRTPNAVVSKQRLIEAVWGDAPVEEGNLIHVIFRLRRAFEDADATVRIETVPRRGYRLVIPVTSDATVNNVHPLPKAPFALGAVALAFVVIFAASQIRHDSTAESILVQRAYTTWFLAKSTDDVEKSIAEFRSALHRAPGNAAAHAGLAYALISLALRESDPVQASVDARTALIEARRAIALDDSIADGHAALAQADVEFGDPLRAEAEFRKAVALDPQSVEARTWYGAFLFARGRAHEARAQFEAAQAQNSAWSEPGDNLALLAYLRRDYQRADAIASESLELAPDDAYARFVRALSEAVTAPSRSAADARLLVRAHPNDALGAYALLSYLEIRRGDERTGQSDLEHARSIVRRERVVSDPLTLISFAGTLAAEHQTDAAFAWLDRMTAGERLLYRGRCPPRPLAPYGGVLQMGCRRVSDLIHA